MNSKIIYKNDYLELSESEYNEEDFILKTYGNRGMKTGEVILSEKDIDKLYHAVKLNKE